MAMNLEHILSKMVELEASDLYLIKNAPPSLKAHGKLVPIDDTKLTPEIIQKIAFSLMTEEQIIAFETMPELNLSYSKENIGRFRVNISKQRQDFALVFRHIKTIIPSYDNLGLPSILTEVIMKQRGLILFVGATGSGKSTSMASLIDYRNSHQGGHNITIEDPIEFIHTHKKSIVSQREIDVHTNSYEDALKNT